MRRQLRPSTFAPISGFSLMMRYVKACLICFISAFTNCFSVELVDRCREKKGHGRRLMVVNVGICLRTETVVWTSEGRRNGQQITGWMGGLPSLGRILGNRIFSFPLPERGTTHTRGLLVAITLGSPSLFQCAFGCPFRLLDA